MFYITVAISAVFVLAGVFFTDPFGSALATVVGWITDYLGWMYMLMTSFFLGFAIWLALSRYGKIRLGQPDDRPEFGRFAWFAILMCLMCWCLYKTLRRDYREGRQQVQEIMAHDQNVEKQQMQEIMRRHEAGEPVGQAVSDSSNGGMRKGQPFLIPRWSASQHGGSAALSAFQRAAYGGLSASQLFAC